jgi:hypothetical protein
MAFPTFTFYFLSDDESRLHFHKESPTFRAFYPIFIISLVNHDTNIRKCGLFDYIYLVFFTILFNFFEFFIDPISITSEHDTFFR